MDHHFTVIKDAYGILSAMYMARKNTGFTIVELLIVIVVIGILAAIVIVSYNGIKNSADRASSASEAKQWAKLFELYKVKHGDLSAFAVGAYCLGTGYPQGYCRTADGSPPYGYAESTSAGIMTTLSDVGNPPHNSHKIKIGNIVGPWVIVTATNVMIYTIIPSDNNQECQKLGMIHDWPSSPVTIATCRIDIARF